MITAFSLTALLLVSAISAKPVVDRNQLVHLPLKHHQNFTTGYRVVEHDRRRARVLNAKARGVVDKSLQGRDSGIDTVAEAQGSFFSSEVGVGDPPTMYTLLIDSGSSNTWVGSRRAYVKTKTSQQTSNDLHVTYGSGEVFGHEFNDQVTLASGLVISSQSIGVATASEGFDNMDGIIGIGPVDLTMNTLNPDNKLIPTVIDNLVSEKRIENRIVGVVLAPPSQNNELVNGELTWGGVNTKNVVGDITYTPRLKTLGFWGIDASIKYGDTSILSQSPGIVDTGTTLLLLSDNAYDAYMKSAGAVFDNCVTHLPVMTADQFKKMQNLGFVISNVAFNLNPSAQIWPRIHNTDIGGIESMVYLAVGKLGDGGNNNDLTFVAGMYFLQRFGVVFDSDNQKIGFHATPHTNTVTN